MSSLITIDGSFGEGGGQILRTSLGLAMVSGRGFRIENIRANRAKPGLLRQHLTAVRAAAGICGATVDGAELGSRRLTFEPGPVVPGDYAFDIGSAGSTTLVLQAVLPGLLCASGPSSLVLKGGTHNPFAPPLDFLERAFLPIVRRTGPNVHVALERAGFAPAGGGRFIVTVEPTPRERMAPVHLTDCGPVRRRTCRAVVAGLPESIAERELDVVRNATGWPADSFEVVRLSDDQGPGNVVTIEVESEHVTEVFTGVGQRGVRAEAVAAEALAQCQRYLAAGVPVGECLADQLLIPLALAGAGSFVTLPLTRHTATNIEVVQMFLGVTISARQIATDQWRVDVKTRSD